MFAHANLLHLAGNMVFLWVFGSHAEDVLGVAKFLGLYVSAGLAAALLQTEICLLSTGEVLGGLGASGAIMGLLALFVFRFPRVNVRFLYWFYMYGGTFEIAARWVALFYIGSDFLTGLYEATAGSMGGVGHWAHVGGFAAGALWAWRLNMPVAAAQDAGREEVERLTQSGAVELAAARAIEEADQYPDNADLQELAAAQCAACGKFSSRCADYWIRALRLRLARREDEETLYCLDRLSKNCGEEAVPADLATSLAEVQVRAGNYAGAVKSLRRVLDGTGPSSARADAALRAGQIALRNIGDATLAEQYFRYVVQAFDGTPQAMDAHDELLRLGSRQAGT